MRTSVILMLILAAAIIISVVLKMGLNNDRLNFSSPIDRGPEGAEVLRSSNSTFNGNSENYLDQIGTEIRSILGNTVDEWGRAGKEGVVFASQFGAVGDGKTDDTKALQKMLDSGHKKMELDSGRVYLVSKNFDLEGFKNNDQPCLLINNKSGIEIDGAGSILIVKEHGQGILEVQKSTDITIRDLHVIGAGKFPPIDGDTGYGEKGISGKGYFTSQFWGFYKNNSLNTSKEHKGGFSGKFLQYRKRTKSDTWGKWNGGFIGNVSYGILIHNGCRNIILEKCKAEYFNYVGLAVGHNGDFYPSDLEYQESKNIIFRNCISNNNYGAGFHSMDVNGFLLVNSVASNSGHPNASPSHEISNPGYGYAARGSSHYTKNARVENSKFSNNKRKGLDVHAGDSITFVDNIVKNSYTCGIYSSWSSSEQPAVNVSIINNIVDSCGTSRASLGAIYVGANASTTSDQKYINAIVKSNKITNYSGSAIRVRYGNTVNIFDNIIKNAINGYGPNLSAILAMGQNENALAHSIDIVNNRIDDELGNISRGIQASNSRNVNINGNEISFEKNIDNAIMVRGGGDVFVEHNDILLLGKGNLESIPEGLRSRSRNITKAQNLLERN